MSVSTTMENLTTVCHINHPRIFMLRGLKTVSPAVRKAEMCTYHMKRRSSFRFLRLLLNIAPPPSLSRIFITTAQTERNQDNRRTHKPENCLMQAPNHAACGDILVTQPNLPCSDEWRFNELTISHSENYPKCMIPGNCPQEWHVSLLSVELVSE